MEKEGRGEKESRKYVEYGPVWKPNNFFVKHLPTFCGNWWFLVTLTEVYCLSHARYNWIYSSHSRSLPRTDHEGPEGE